MKVGTLLPVALMLLCGAGLAHAGTVATGLHAGLSLPSGDASRSTGDGFHGGVSLEYTDETRNGLGIDANYHAFREKTDVLRVWGTPLSMTAGSSILETVLYVRAVLTPKGSRIAPYLKGGFGIDHVEGDLAIRTPLAYARVSSSETWLGLVGGIGVAFPVTDATDLRLEGLFHQAEADGGTANWFTVSVGLQ